MPETKYIWQSPKWPQFTWNDSKILPLLSQARKRQGALLARASELGLDLQVQILTDEAQKTSAIEGEKLEAASLRSSIAKRLGIPNAGIPSKDRNIQGLIEMLIDATQNFKNPLTDIRIKGWQAGLFPTGYSGIHQIVTGSWRTSNEPMQVVSGQMGKAKVHYEAPPATQLKKEMTSFIKWFNSKQKIDGLIRAAVAHFWFVTIHPFDDGNGRIARAISDLALAQDEDIAKRCYSLSSQISHDRNAYYKILETSQKGSVEITDWIIWFLETYTKALSSSEAIVEKTLLINSFWKIHAQTDLNPRQKKVLQKILEFEPDGFQGGMTNMKYVSINRVSSATAKRDLRDLEEKGILKRNDQKGRSLSYSLKRK